MKTFSTIFLAVAFFGTVAGFAYLYQGQTGESSQPNKVERVEAVNVAPKSTPAKASNVAKPQPQTANSLQADNAKAPAASTVGPFPVRTGFIVDDSGSRTVLFHNGFTVQSFNY